MLVPSSLGNASKTTLVSSCSPLIRNATCCSRRPLASSGAAAMRSLQHQQEHGGAALIPAPLPRNRRVSSLTCPAASQKGPGPSQEEDFV
jgi:hypothetical protein